jgi:hypothetical protein
MLTPAAQEEDAVIPANYFVLTGDGGVATIGTTDSVIITHLSPSHSLLIT